MLWKRIVCEGKERQKGKKRVLVVSLSLSLSWPHPPPRILGDDMRGVRFGREMGMLVGGVIRCAMGAGLGKEKRAG